MLFYKLQKLQTMTHEDLFFLMAIDSVSVTQKQDYWLFPRDERPDENFDEQLFKEVKVHVSMFFSQSDITSFDAHVSLSLTSPVNGHFMCFDFVISWKVSSILEDSKCDYIKSIADVALRNTINEVESALEAQFKTKEKPSKENAK